MTPPAILKKRPRHKWFSATSFFAENWFGPFDTFEEAAAVAFAEAYDDADLVCVTQGYKLTKAEIEGFGGEYGWECDVAAAVTVHIPRVGGSR